MIVEYIRYRIDAALTGRFRQSADFRPFLEATQPFYGDIEEMTHSEVIQGCARRATASPPVRELRRHVRQRLAHRLLER